MSKKYYVVGFADTRQEFFPKGVSTSKAKAEKYKKELARTLYENDRQWATIREVDGIK